MKKMVIDQADKYEICLAVEIEDYDRLIEYTPKPELALVQTGLIMALKMYQKVKKKRKTKEALI